MKTPGARPSVDRSILRIRTAKRVRRPGVAHRLCGGRPVQLAEALRRRCGPTPLSAIDPRPAATDEVLNENPRREAGGRWRRMPDYIRTVEVAAQVIAE